MAALILYVRVYWPNSIWLFFIHKIKFITKIYVIFCKFLIIKFNIHIGERRKPLGGKFKKINNTNKLF